MNTTFPVSSPAYYSWLAPLVSTLGILLFFFFIDEGYYDFRWMEDGGNWVVFFIYFVIMFPVQLGVSELLLHKVPGRRKFGFMVLFVMPLTIGALIGVSYRMSS